MVMMLEPRSTDGRRGKLYPTKFREGSAADFGGWENQIKRGSKENGVGLPMRILLKSECAGLSR